MARVCTGCGLYSDNGNLTIAGLEEWGYDCDQVGGGDVQRVYCDATVGINGSGTLHGEPKFHSRLSSASSTFLIPGTVIPADGDEHQVPPNGVPGIQFINPSDCLPANTFSTWTYDMDMSLPVGARIQFFADGNELFDFTNQGNATITSLGWELGFTFVTAHLPGEDIFQQFLLSMRASGSAVTVNRIQYRLRALTVNNQT